jgi:hypothetical protein
MFMFCPLTFIDPQGAHTARNNAKSVHQYWSGAVIAGNASRRERPMRGNVLPRRCVRATGGVAADAKPMTARGMSAAGRHLEEVLRWTREHDCQWDE